jgi:hypothetical protein
MYSKNCKTSQREVEKGIRECRDMLWPGGTRLYIFKTWLLSKCTCWFRWLSQPYWAFLLVEIDKVILKFTRKYSRLTWHSQECFDMNRNGRLTVFDFTTWQGSGDLVLSSVHHGWKDQWGWSTLEVEPYMGKTDFWQRWRKNCLVYLFIYFLEICGWNCCISMWNKTDSD